MTPGRSSLDDVIDVDKAGLDRSLIVRSIERLVLALTPYHPYLRGAPAGLRETAGPRGAAELEAIREHRQRGGRPDAYPP